MKQVILFTLLFMFSVQSLHADSFFKVFATDIKDWVKGNASSEQKERLSKQAALFLITASIMLYCVAASGAMWHGKDVPPLRLHVATPSGHTRPRGPLGRQLPRRRSKLERMRSLSNLRSPDAPEELDEFFGADLPHPGVVLRAESPLNIADVARIDTDTIHKRENLTAGIMEPEPLC